MDRGENEREGAVIPGLGRERGPTRGGGKENWAAATGLGWREREGGTGLTLVEDFGPEEAG